MTIIDQTERLDEIRARLQGGFPPDHAGDVAVRENSARYLWQVEGQAWETMLETTLRMWGDNIIGKENIKSSTFNILQ